MSDEGDCRTAPATPGLLIISLVTVVVLLTVVTVGTFSGTKLKLATVVTVLNVVQ